MQIGYCKARLVGKGLWKKNMRVIVKFHEHCGAFSLVGNSEQLVYS